MPKETNHQAIVKLISCLSFLEEKTHVLYKTLAEKIDLPIVRSLVLIMAQDSQKHFIALKNIGEAISPKGVKVKIAKRTPAYLGNQSRLFSRKSAGRGN